MTRARRAVAVLTLVVATLLASAGGAAAATPSDDIADQCRTIVGCADPGPDPEAPGDRGGYAQLLTLAVLAGGVGFIAWRVARSARPNVTPSGASEPD